MGLFSISAVAVDVNAPSAILMECATGEILMEKNSHEKLHPASVTKVMTLLLLAEALEAGQISWQDTVTTSAFAAGKGGSQIFLEEGEQMKLEEMFKSVVIASANDCATALAEHLCGSEEAFVEKMNARAKELGMDDTHFVNCTGLDDDPDTKEHLTTAYDIAIMSRELLRHPKVKQYTTVWMDTVRNGAFGLTNTNKLVRFYPGATGLKTGFTAAAGYCLSASAEKEGMELLAVVMHCDTSVNRFESAKALLNYGFAQYALYTPPTADIPAIPITLGRTDSLTPVAEGGGPVLTEKALKNGITIRTETEESLQAPVEKGQKVGTLTVESQGKVLKEIPLVAGESVPRLSVWDLFLRMLGKLCMA
jgi:D-alanyl-D-alanine carboxypeptidase (penicillin-binding protein 5/6)